MSQGLLDYSHVSQSLSKFTCSNIKNILSMLRFDIYDDELTCTNPPLSHYEFGTC